MNMRQRAAKWWTRLGLQQSAALVICVVVLAGCANFRNTTVGRLNEGLNLASNLGWHLINMKSDWKVIYPFELK